MHERDPLDIKEFALREFLLDSPLDDEPLPSFNVGDIINLQSDPELRGDFASRLEAVACITIDSISSELGLGGTLKKDSDDLNKRISNGVLTGLSLDTAEFVDYGLHELCTDKGLTLCMGWELQITGTQRFTSNYAINLCFPFVVLKHGNNYRFGPYNHQTQKIEPIKNQEILTGLQALKNISAHNMPATKKFVGASSLRPQT